MEWQPIETAPKDGTWVDLWIVGEPDEIDFYCAVHRRSKDRGSREGRLPDMRWEAGHWRAPTGLTPGARLSSGVTATHWQPLPAPPPSSPAADER